MLRGDFSLWSNKRTRGISTNETGVKSKESYPPHRSQCVSIVPPASQPLHCMPYPPRQIVAIFADRVIGSRNLSTGVIHQTHKLLAV